MDSKMLKSQEQSEQLHNEELEAIAGRGLNDLVKNFSLPGKVARWAAVAASVVGISVGMVMPAHAINRSSCERDTFNIAQTTRNDDRVTMCFANAGDTNVVIADVRRVTSGNNAGYIITNKGRFNFGKNQGYDFIRNNYGTVTILRIVIY